MTRKFLKPFVQTQEAGMTIIEILIVIAIISTIMGVLANNFWGKREEANVKLTRVLQSQLSENLNMYRLSTSQFPTNEQGLQALLKAPAGARNWSGPYAEAEKLNDTWGKPLQYELVNPKRFTITSAGMDGEFGTEDDIIHPPAEAPSR